jgi:hypothetical protein
MDLCPDGFLRARLLWLPVILAIQLVMAAGIRHADFNCPPMFFSGTFST